MKFFSSHHRRITWFILVFHLIWTVGGEGWHSLYHLLESQGQRLAGVNENLLLEFSESSASSCSCCHTSSLPSSGNNDQEPLTGKLQQPRITAPHSGCCHSASCKFSQLLNQSQVANDATGLISSLANQIQLTTSNDRGNVNRADSLPQPRGPPANATFA